MALAVPGGWNRALPRRKCRPRRGGPGQFGNHTLLPHGTGHPEFRASLLPGLKTSGFTIQPCGNAIHLPGTRTALAARCWRGWGQPRSGRRRFVRPPSIKRTD